MAGKSICPELIFNFDSTSIFLEEKDEAIFLTRDADSFLREHHLNASTTHATHKHRGIGHIAVLAADGLVLAHVFVIRDRLLKDCALRKVTVVLSLPMIFLSLTLSCMQIHEPFNIWLRLGPHQKMERNICGDMCFLISCYPP